MCQLVFEQMTLPAIQLLIPAQKESRDDFGLLAAIQRGLPLDLTVLATDVLGACRPCRTRSSNRLFLLDHVHSYLDFQRACFA